MEIDFYGKIWENPKQKKQNKDQDKDNSQNHKNKIHPQIGS